MLNWRYSLSGMKKKHKPISVSIELVLKKLKPFSMIHWRLQFPTLITPSMKTVSLPLASPVKSIPWLSCTPNVKSEYFPTAEAVNHALRTLISLVPRERKTAAGKKHGAAEAAP